MLIYNHHDGKTFYSRIPLVLNSHLKVSLFPTPTHVYILKTCMRRAQNNGLSSVDFHAFISLPPVVGLHVLHYCHLSQTIDNTVLTWIWNIAVKYYCAWSSHCIGWHGDFTDLRLRSNTFVWEWRPKPPNAAVLVWSFWPDWSSVEEVTILSQ